MKYVDGPLYTEHRDGWLRRTPNARALLRRYAERPGWHDRVMAEILGTWLDHRPDAEALIDQIDHVDWEKERRSILGPDPVFEQYRRLAALPGKRGWILPLCWEMALKRRNEWPVYKRMTFFSMMEQPPDTLSAEVLFHYLRVIASNDFERSFTRGGLQRMPQAMLKPHALRMKRENGDAVTLLTEAFPALFAEGSP